MSTDPLFTVMYVETNNINIFFNEKKSICLRRPKCTSNYIVVNNVNQLTFTLNVHRHATLWNVMSSVATTTNGHTSD